jgi:hypothetical protein|tara:strand:- start:449 stop:616 length:168 start_codon:yes stop_codon:yes gene_type:complete
MEKRISRFEDESRPNHKARIRYRYSGKGKFAVRKRQKQKQAIARQIAYDLKKGEK